MRVLFEGGCYSRAGTINFESRYICTENPQSNARVYKGCGCTYYTCIDGYGFKAIQPYTI